MTPPTPFVTSIEQTLPRSDIGHTYVQVHTSPSREFVRFEKRFISCIFRQCRPGVLLLVYCCWRHQTTSNGVSLQTGPVRRLFQRCAANTLSRRSSNIAPRLTSRTAPSRVGPTFKFVNKMESKFLEP